MFAEADGGLLGIERCVVPSVGNCGGALTSSSTNYTEIWLIRSDNPSIINVDILSLSPPYLASTGTG